MQIIVEVDNAANVTLTNVSVPADVEKALVLKALRDAVAIIDSHYELALQQPHRPLWTRP